MTIAELMASIEGQSFGHQVTAVRRLFAVPDSARNIAKDPDYNTLFFAWLDANKYKLVSTRDIGMTREQMEGPDAPALIDAWFAEHPEITG